MPTTYEHITFKFNRSSNCLDGSKFVVTAYLAVPENVMPELHQWEQVESMNRDDRPRNHLSPSMMFKSLKDKGALLHREDGPAYEEIETDIRGNTKIAKSEFWLRGVAQNPAGGPVVKSLGKLEF